ncbi:glycoside hydrolase family 28 protein [Murimonas intestini]|uniref:Polygalacturonase n=1 Tax=Murimonas intestini TaxID=1337051 RepID=A0AB73T5G3_9FIRM|nr:glycosyl hydrolase family 28 protein [Murimonas intestini]MCR1840641.1 glycosyl hydrolase family 28 protein [Murimonas intestini]MCR1865306.1 glycosyl hydrolase family 28 protein [Murimonas intestini]MCR1882983.1 glycosyl hydrolase family 28 protein [Murimonas intestini]
MDRKEFLSSEYGIDCSGTVLVTEKLQALIDDAAAAGGRAVLKRGTYLTGALFLKSGLEFTMEEGCILKGTTDESQYPLIETRVAGIEMKWPAAVLNCNHQRGVSVTGKGVINGQGPYWWEKYWGKDRKGGMRGEYDAKGLRWAADYDCTRVRNVVIFDSSEVLLKDFTSEQSGFWNVHICYCSHVHVDGIRIAGNAGSPSTDGIDIDSSSHVLVENCETSCDDDSICIKSGRDADGLRTARPSHHITIRNCRIHAGFGVTLGSELSGGIEDVIIRDLQYEGTDCGFRIKSSRPRRGYIKNILVENLQMKNVKYPFHICLDWNPAYCTCELPDGYEGEVPESWRKLLEPVPEDEPLTHVSNITVRNVRAENDAGYSGISRAFDIEGYREQPIESVKLSDIHMSVREFGRISYVKELQMDHVTIEVAGDRDTANDTYDNR